jgi:hypothetical protein
MHATCTAHAVLPPRFQLHNKTWLEVIQFTTPGHSSFHSLNNQHSRKNLQPTTQPHIQEQIEVAAVYTVKVWLLLFITSVLDGMKCQFHVPAAPPVPILQEERWDPQSVCRNTLPEFEPRLQEPPAPNIATTRNTL